LILDSLRYTQMEHEPWGRLSSLQKHSMVPPVDSLDLGMLVFPRSRLFWPIVGFGLRQNPEETIGRWGGYLFGRCCRYRYTKDIEERGRQLMAGETLTQFATGDIRYRTVLIMLGLRHTVGRGGWSPTCD